MLSQAVCLIIEEYFCCLYFSKRMVICLVFEFVLHAVAVEHSHRAEDFAYTTIIYAYNILSCLLIIYFQFGSLSQEQLQEGVLLLNELWGSSKSNISYRRKLSTVSTSNAMI